MFLSSLVRTTVVCCLAVIFPALVFAQSDFRPNAGEQAITGFIPGSQTRPHLSLGPSGGFLVWEDDNLDGDGLGIAAMALDRNFSRVLTRFRVNSTRVGDQERPQVAVFPDGGAAFVWQGGRQGFQNIYARFLSASNLWINGDVLVNSVTNRSQRNPAAVALQNGNLAVVWGAFNQQATNSMQDVYGQLLTAGGQKVGLEFLVNQATEFNQRTPAIAALANGGFVVVWVSEQQRNRVPVGIGTLLDSPANLPSVDIYGRVFDAMGSAMGDEFLINSSLKACANPSIAAFADGGFVVVWGERDLEVRSNSWDIFGRSFNSFGQGGAVRRFNTTTYGDQFQPQLSAQGGGALVVWNSLAQDGSAEGVYGQFLNPDGSLSGTEFKVNTTIISKQIHPITATDREGRFLVAWTSFVTGGSFDLFAQGYVSSHYSPGEGGPQYAPPPNDPFGSPLPPVAGGPGPSAPPALDIPPPAPGGIASNAFDLAIGNYNGLFHNTEGVTASSAGSFSAKVAANGVFSAKLLLAGRSYALSGKFNAQGATTNTIVRPGASSLTVDLQLDLSGGDQIRGHISSGAWVADLAADRLIYSKTQPRAPQAGNYVLIIPGDAQDSTRPGGDSFGTVKVDAGGTILFSGMLADGTKITQSGALSKKGVWPLFVSLNAGQGSVMSWIQFSNHPSSDLGGQLIWIKPAGGSSKYYRQGFTNSVWATGSAYQVPSAGARALSLSEARLSLNGGGLSQTLNYNLTLGLNNRVTPAGGAKLTLLITPTTGLFKGTAVNPATGKSVTFQGALFKKANIGVGYFLGADQSGGVYLSSAP